MREIPSIAQRQFGVFTRQQALLDGWTRSALLHAVRSGQLLRARDGVFVPADAVAGIGPHADQRRLRVTTAAAALAVPAAVASHASAAALAGLPVWRWPDRPCITVPPRHTGDAGAVHLHRAALPGRYRRRAGDIARTSVARAFCDLAREHGVENAVVLGDAALHRGVIQLDDLERCRRDCRRWPGIRRAEAALRVVDHRSESPIETVSRLRLSIVGVPAPQLQPTLIGIDGTPLGRADFYWDEFGVVGEVDGKLKYTDPTDPEALWKEKRRQEGLEDAGLIVVRWGRAHLGDMGHLAGRLNNAFTRSKRRSASERGWVVRPAA
jgi:hypothetical protein